jgi:hypothetical protein
MASDCKEWRRVALDHCAMVFIFYFFGIRPVLSWLGGCLCTCVPYSGMGTVTPSLTHKRHRCHFVAYEWQYTCLEDKGRQFFIQDFWGSLVGKLCTTSNWKIFLECLPLSVRMSFAKKTDDYVVYFFIIEYICWNSI